MIYRVAVKEGWKSDSLELLLQITWNLEQACSVYEEAAILLTPVLELIAQMSGLRFRPVGGLFMS